jgi:hypothetical protein
MSAHADALDCREKSGERRAAQYFIGTDYKPCAGLEEAGGLQKHDPPLDWASRRLQPDC